MAKDSGDRRSHACTDAYGLAEVNPGGTSYEARRLRRLLADIQVNPATGCWHWTRKISDNGYGRTSFRGRDSAAHRVAYELLRGPIPAGLELDHLCRVRHCVNPDHLEAVTGRENRIRGHVARGGAERRTHCPAGHPYEGDNLAENGGSRACRECWRIRARDRYYRLRTDRPSRQSAMAPGGKACGECGRSTTRLNRDRCAACYSRFREREKAAGTWVPLRSPNGTRKRGRSRGA
jgi:hypothetical protein